MKKKREKAAEQPVKRPFFTTANFVTAVVCLVAFLAVGLTAYYFTAGEFVSARLASIYAILALVGSLAILFRLYRFVGLYYVGCVIGWVVGWAVGGLKGDFAPTAGVICTVFFIAIFAVFGALAQWKGLRKMVAKRREAKAAAAAQEEEDRKSGELDRARLERENAEALMHDAFGVEDNVDVTTPAAALDQAARLAFAEEEPAQLEIPADRLAPEGLEPAPAVQPLPDGGQQTFTASQPATVLDQPLPQFPEGQMPTDPGPMAPPTAEKTAAAPVGTAAAEEDKPQI